MHPFFARAFQRDQEHDFKHPSLVDLMSINKTKQNKQTIHCVMVLPNVMTMINILFQRPTF
jgi:hypothetical protein